MIYVKSINVTNMINNGIEVPEILLIVKSPKNGYLYQLVFLLLFYGYIGLENIIN